MLSTFKQFMADEDAWDMYVTGSAGTGKTTGLSELVQYCIDSEIPYLVCAYTHKACDVLRSKLPVNAEITTLHSFLKKRPTINQNAVSKKHLQSNSQTGKPVRPRVVFIDEYSMIGERDGIDIRAEQDPDYDGTPALKVLWLGDKNQLPPVGDMPFVVPEGPYNLVLTKIHRQKDGNQLLDTLSSLVNMIERTTKPGALAPNKNFVRGIDIVQKYKENALEADAHGTDYDQVILAYTNERVEKLNSEIEGMTEPMAGSRMFSPTTKKTYKFNEWVDKPEFISLPFDGELHLNSKYQTLEHLVKSGLCRFASVDTEDGETTVIATVFGHYQYKLTLDELKSDAADSNKAIEVKHRGFKAAVWAKANAKTPLARNRAKAWRDFLSFDECVMCLDFTHAMTVHKSQGSTFSEVLLDTDDIYRCAALNFDMYLKLMYVGISRSSGFVYTN